MKRGSSPGRENTQRRYADPDLVVDAFVEDLAQARIAEMSPLEIGRLVYPKARPVPLEFVPSAVIGDHLSRYSRRELARGQFFEVVPGKYTFFMDHEAKRRREGQS